MATTWREMTEAEAAAHRQSRQVLNFVSRWYDRRAAGHKLVTLEETAGLLIVGLRPPDWSRARWACWCFRVALTGRRP